MQNRAHWSAPGRWMALGTCCIMLIAAGCESHEPSPIQKNIDTFQLAERKMGILRTHVIDTLRTLHEFSESPSGYKFDAFIQRVDATEAAGAALPDVFAVLNDQCGAYFLQWDQDIAAMSEPNLKAQTARQKVTAKAAFDQIETQRPKLVAAYDAFVNDLHNLRTYFGYNKSATGISEASNLISATRIDGAELLRQLDFQIANVSNVRNVFITISSG